MKSFKPRSPGWSEWFDPQPEPPPEPLRAHEVRKEKYRRRRKSYYKPPPTKPDMRFRENKAAVKTDE